MLGGRSLPSGFVRMFLWEFFQANLWPTATDCLWKLSLTNPYRAKFYLPTSSGFIVFIPFIHMIQIFLNIFCILLSGVHIYLLYGFPFLPIIQDANEKDGIVCQFVWLFYLIVCFFVIVGLFLSLWKYVCLWSRFLFYLWKYVCSFLCEVMLVCFSVKVFFFSFWKSV